MLIRKLQNQAKTKHRFQAQHFPFSGCSHVMKVKMPSSILKIPTFLSWI
jgi:hypothetical protein